MARRLLVLILLVLAAVGCGEDDDPTLAAPTDTTVTTVADGVVVGETPPSTSPSAEPGVPPPRPSGDSPATTVPEGSPTTTTPAPPTGTSWPDLDGSGPPGSFADDLLRADRSAVIEVQILTQPGAEPRQATLDHLATVLREVTGGKRIVLSGGPTPPTRDAWTADDVRAAAGRAAHGNGRAMLRLLFVHGRFSEADGVLGISVQGDAAALFSDEIEGAGSPLVGSAAIETAVTVHEAGHLLGLVDLHLDTGRDDPEHPGHSTNRGSVMYWAVESTLVADVLAGGPPRRFDAADLADLARIRGD